MNGDGNGRRLKRETQPVNWTQLPNEQQKRLSPGVRGTTDTAMNVVATVGAGPTGPLTDWVGFGVPNAVAPVLVLQVLAFWAVLVPAG